MSQTPAPAPESGGCVIMGAIVTSTMSSPRARQPQTVAGRSMPALTFHGCHRHGAQAGPCLPCVSREKEAGRRWQRQICYFTWLTCQQRHIGVKNCIWMACMGLKFSFGIKSICNDTEGIIPKTNLCWILVCEAVFRQNFWNILQENIERNKWINFFSWTFI
jgi:hypothetical protein